MKKRILSAALAVCMLLSLSLSAFAITANVSVDKPTVKAGEDVAVTLSMSDALSDIVTIAYKVRFDSSLFTPKSCTTAAGQPYVTMSIVKKDAKGSYVNVSTMDPTSEGQTVQAGAFCTVVFTAKSDVSAETTAAFISEFENAMDTTFQPIHTGHDGGSVSVKVKPASTAYTVALTAAPATVGIDENAQVKLTVSDTYNAYRFVLSYDAEKLEYKSVNTDASVKNERGTLTVTGYGADRSDPVVLTFTGKAAGKAGVTLTAANIDSGDNANVQDAPEATITAASADIEVISSHTVTFDAKLFSGNTTAEHGKDYTFSKTDKDPKHYTYTVSATMGGKDTAVTDNGDGTYTIANVTGDVVITGSRKAVRYPITVNGSGAKDAVIADDAAYGEDYVFSVNVDADYDYTFEMTIGGVKKNLDLEDIGDAYLCTISGADITGSIVITINKTKKTPATTSILFTGSGSGDVAGGVTQQAKTGEAFTFTINKKDGYTYTVTARQNDSAITVKDNGNGTYTIDKQYVNGTDITVEVGKTANRTVEVSEYVKLNGKSMFLVTVSGPVSDGNVMTYGGEAMFWSEKYSAYAYLVISDKQLGAVKEAVAGLIGEKAGVKAEIRYDGDINGTGRVDVNDAQLVWNMYNAKYAAFGTTTMEMFLRADMNGSKTLNVDDAAAIINLI